MQSLAHRERNAQLISRGIPKPLNILRFPHMSMLAWVVGHGRRAEEVETGDRGEEREGINRRRKRQRESREKEREKAGGGKRERRERIEKEREKGGERKRERERKGEGVGDQKQGRSWGCREFGKWAWRARQRRSTKQTIGFQG